MMDLSQTPALASFLALALAEFGDATFIVATIMASKYSRIAVFAGCMLGNSIVQIVSVFLGFYLDKYIPKNFINSISMILFLFYGTMMIKDQFIGKKSEINEEEVEAEESVKSFQQRYQQNDIIPKSAVFLSCVAQTLIGEWGDKSQITTIALSSQYEVTPILIGTIGSLILTMGMAVLGGKILAQHASEKVLNIGGGFLMLYFAVDTATKFQF